MSVVSKILGKFIGEAGANLTGEIFDGISKLDNSTEKMELQFKFKELLTQVQGKMLDFEAKILSLQAGVIKAEAKGNLLQRTWRPILMLTFGFVIVSRWFGFTVDVPLESELRMWNIIELGLGGYVIGRSAEKIVSNIDLTTILKKKEK